MKTLFVFTGILFAASALAGELSLHVDMNGKDCIYSPHSYKGTSELTAYGGGLNAGGVEFSVDGARFRTNDTNCPRISYFKIRVTESVIDPYENYFIATLLISRARTAQRVFLSTSIPSVKLTQINHCYDNSFKEIECKNNEYFGEVEFKKLNEYHAIIGSLQEE